MDDLSSELLLPVSFMCACLNTFLSYLEYVCQLSDQNMRQSHSSSTEMAKIKIPVFIGMCRQWQTSRHTLAMQEHGCDCHWRRNSCPDTCALYFQILHCSGTARYLTAHCSSPSRCRKFDNFTWLQEPVQALCVPPLWGGEGAVSIPPADSECCWLLLLHQHLHWYQWVCLVHLYPRPFPPSQHFPNTHVDVFFPSLL
jgi:hypothetical protein